MRPVIGAVVVLLSATLAQADELEVSSDIASVTVFPRGAEVTRVAEIKLAPGEHTLIFKDLPIHLLPGSVRVEGKATGGLEIGSVDTQQVFVSDDDGSGLGQTERKRLEDEIERLQDQRRSLENAIAAAEAQKVLIKNLAGLPSRPVASNSGAAHRSPQDWTDLITLIGSQMAAANKTVEETRIAIRDVDERVTDLQKKLAAIAPRRERRTEVRIAVGANSQLEGTLDLRYQVRNARWSPLYDARLSLADDATKPAVELQRRALIVQNTGEAWENVRLALSTTQPQRGTATPNLRPIRVEFVPDEPVVEMSRGRTQFADKEMEDDVAQDRIGGIVASEPAAAPKALLEKRKVRRREAIISNAPFQAIYEIPGKQTVKPDGTRKRVQIDTVALPAELDIRAVPRLSPTAYLYAKLKLGEGLRVLPGPAALFRNGVFVGNGHLPVLSSGEEHELGFGVDDAVRIRYNELERTAGETGTFSTSKTDTRRYKIHVKNLHAQPIKLRVVDRVPVSGDEEIDLVLTGDALKPSVKDLDDKRGVVAWDFELEPQAERELAIGYRLTWPADKKIHFVPSHYPIPLKR